MMPRSLRWTCLLLIPGSLLGLTLLASATSHGGGKEGTTIPGPVIRIEFDNLPKSKYRSMRFGISLVNEYIKPGEPKRLTYHPQGMTNNTCLKINGQERLLGFLPGRWEARELPLGKDAAGNPRHGLKSVWSYPQEQIFVTQTVELVRGELTGRLDTCRVHYLVQNKDVKEHSAGLRVLLDTLIGGNDGAPFILPGESSLCETFKDYRGAKDVPAFALAFERMNLTNPGVVAYLKPKLGGKVETPNRVVFGAWPDRRSKLPGAKSEFTLWDVPVFSIKLLQDSAVVLYWIEKKLAAGEQREYGFSYGLGHYLGSERGDLGLVFQGSYQAEEDLTVLALVNQPRADDTLTLTVPEDLKIVQGTVTQKVPRAPTEAGLAVTLVTWVVRPTRPGVYPVSVESNRGTSLLQGLRISKKG